MASDHPQNHGDQPPKTWNQPRSRARQSLPRATEAVRRTQVRTEEELPELQLRVLSPSPEDGLQTVLHVLSLDQELAEAAAARRDVG